MYTTQPMNTQEQAVVTIARDTIADIGSSGCPDCGHDDTALKRVFGKQQCATYYRDVDGWGDVVDCYCRDTHHARVVKTFNDRPQIEA